MILLTNKEITSYEKQNVCHICKKEFCNDDRNKKKSQRSLSLSRRYLQSNYNVPKKIPIVFHNGSTYDYHFVIKKLVKESEGEFECLGENTEKYVTFAVPLKKEDDGKITYKLKFIDSHKFIQTSLSNLVDNLFGVYDKECKKCIERKKIRLNCEFVGSKNGGLKYTSKECKKSCTKVVTQSTKNFPTFHEFCSGDMNELFLLLRKGIYPYEYIDGWETFHENIIPPKEACYSKLDLENITDKDSEHVKKVWKAFGIKNLGEYLYVQCDTFCLLMYLKTLEISALKYMCLILLIFCLHQD